MTLQQINKTLYQGVDDELAFIITDSNGAARDITNATFKFTAYHPETGDVLPKTLGHGLAFGTAKSGQVAALFTADEMTIPPLTYSFQLEMIITISGVTTTSIEATGCLTVEPNVRLDGEWWAAHRNINI